MWTLLALALPLGIHAWVVYVAHGHGGLVARGTGSTWASRSTPGVWVVLLLFLTGVWAASGGGYFWPVWPLLVALLATRRSRRGAARAPPDTSALTERISTLESSRAGAVDVQEAELRRIERDLHDGAQARLVALGMSLGMAEQKLASEPEVAAELLADARRGRRSGAARAARPRPRHPPAGARRSRPRRRRSRARRRLADLRHGVGDRAGASRSRPSRAPPTSSSPRPSPTPASTRAPVASTCESRAPARSCRVEVARRRRRRRRPVGRRARAACAAASRRSTGRLEVISPPGGPTTIRAELPCGS